MLRIAIAFSKIWNSKAAVAVGSLFHYPKQISR
jgi:hypothetical protein